MASSSSHRSKTPSPFAEAMGGAIGALWCSLLFYPLDVAKIRLQAEADADEEEEEGEESKTMASEQQQQQPAEGKEVVATEHDSRSSVAHVPTKTKAPKTFFGEVLVVLKQPELWYAGLGLKLQLAVLSTFVYFYVYTSLKKGFSRLFKKTVTFLPNLLLASMAGVVNILVTMPLDTVVTRLQVAARGQRPSFREMVRLLWEDEQGPKQESKQPHASCSHQQTFWKLARFWHGLLPALLLTSNPAINYAAYDAIKAAMPLPPGKRHHDAKQTFLIGMLSKFLATLITYPLIRAKVMMMADTKRARHLQPHLLLLPPAAGAAAVGTETTDVEVGSSSAVMSSPPNTPASLLAQSPSVLMAQQEKQGLWAILAGMVQEGGVRELYVGLDGQIINTALKNAVLLNTKDRISRITSFLVRQFFMGTS